MASDIDTVIKTGIGLRAVVRSFGYANLHEYFTACDELAKDLPDGFSRDTGEYLVERVIETKIATSLDRSKTGVTIDIPKLIFREKTKQRNTHKTTGG